MKDRFQTLNEILIQDNKGAKFLNSLWKSVIDEDPLFLDVFTTIDLVFGNGNIIRISSDEIVVKDESNHIGYLPLLMDEPSISSTYTIGSGDASQRSISFSLDGRLVDALSIISSGTIIAGVGQISLQYRGGEYGNRFVLMQGIMTGGIEFGSPDEPILLSISDPVITKDRIAPQFFITRDDFPHMPDSAIGQKFPLVINGFHGGIPCIRLIATSHYEYGCTFLVCLGHSIQIDTVTVDGVEVDKFDEERGWSVLRKSTVSGIPYTAIDFVFPASVAENPNTDEADALKGLWPDNVSVFVRGSVNENERKGILECIKSLILENTNFKHDDFDWNLYAKSQSKCPYIGANIIINSSDSDSEGTIVEYIQSTLLQSIPMINILFNRVGIGICFTDRRITNAQQDLVKGQNILIDRVSSIKETPASEVFNSFSIKYNYDTVSNNYRDIETVDSSNNVYCKISEETFGKIQHSTIENIILFDKQTVNYIASWMAAHMSLPRYTVQYSATSSVITYLDLGDNVTITDEELGWNKIPATITGIDYKQGITLLTFTCWIIFSGVEKNLLGT